jgi:hypothetical protein
MPEDADEAVKRYLAEANPAERRELANALLDSSTNRLTRAPAEVPLYAVLLSRLASTAIVILELVLLPDTGIHRTQVLAALFFPLVVAWFPNEIARATGRIDMVIRIDRASARQITLTLGWALLLMPLVFRVVR